MLKEEEVLKRIMNVIQVTDYLLREEELSRQGLRLEAGGIQTTLSTMKKVNR